MTSVQDLLASQNGLFGADHIADSVGNTGTGPANIHTGLYGFMVVHEQSTLSANSTGLNITNLTGVSLSAGTYAGLYPAVQLSGGDITMYKVPSY